MRNKSLVFFVFVGLVGFFPLYGCKSAEVKPVAAEAPEVKVEAVQPAAPQPQAPVPAHAEQLHHPTPQKPERVFDVAPQKAAPRAKQGDVSFNFDDADVYSVAVKLFTKTPTRKTVISGGMKYIESENPEDNARRSC